jgi:hypothetical protein
LKSVFIEKADMDDSGISEVSVPDYLLLRKHQGRYGEPHVQPDGVFSMHVTLESPDAENSAVHAQSLRRIRSAMRSLSWLVLRAKVKLTAVDDTPPGSIDKRCEVELITEDGTPVVVTSLARDFQSAMHSALARASRSLLHRWQQQQARAAAPALPRRLVGA